jgi:hypothetical protein
LAESSNTTGALEGWYRRVHVLALTSRVLPESDQADMAFFIEQVRIILPVLGFNFLRDRQKLADQIHSPDDVCHGAA